MISFPMVNISKVIWRTTFDAQDLIFDTDHNLVCRHGDLGVTSYHMYCTHLDTLKRMPVVDARVMSELTKHYFATYNEGYLTLPIQVQHMVFKDVTLVEAGESIAVGIPGYNDLTVGYIDTAYEGLTVLQAMIIDHYEAWTEASLTMCTSSNHWKSAGSKSGRRAPTLEDKVCLDQERMCFQCCYRSAEALSVATAPESGGRGFDSLPKSSTTAVYPKASPVAKNFTPTITASSDQVYLQSGINSLGGPLTTGTSAYFNGTLHVWNGTTWTKPPTDDDNPAPFPAFA